MNHSIAAPPRQIPALDGIRGIAIIWVVLHNATAEPYLPPHGALRLLTLVTHTGWIGVQLFFALSGFLITAGLLETRGAAHYFRDFYAKRALRILPLYYTVLLVMLVILPRLMTLGPPFSHDEQASVWLFTVNWTHSAPYGFAHFWSLAVEEQFYLFWPLVVYRLAPRRLFMVCLWIAFGALLLRSVMAALGASGWALYTDTACRMDALALGGAGACVLRVPELLQWVRKRLGTISVATLLMFLVGALLTHAYDTERLAGQTLGYTLLAVCGATFVTAAALPAMRGRGSIRTLLAWGPLRSCGIYSYAMYIFHNLLHKLLGEPWLIARFGGHLSVQVVFVYGLAVLAASYILGFLSYHMLEKHFLRLKARLAPRGAGANAS